METEQVAHDCGLAAAQLADLVLPSQTADGQPAPALKFGQPRVTALLGAVCSFACTPEGVTSGRLRPVVAHEHVAAQVLPPLRQAFAALDAATDALIEEARLAAY